MAGRSVGTDPAKYSGAIDCDLHAAVPGMKALLPYLDDYWREMVSVRALDRLNLSLTSYPRQCAAVVPPGLEAWERKKPGSSLKAMQEHIARSLSAALSASSIACTAPRSFTAKTWRLRFAGQPTTGSATSGSAAIRGCVRRS